MQVEEAEALKPVDLFPPAAKKTAQNNDDLTELDRVEINPQAVKLGLTKRSQPVVPNAPTLPPPPPPPPEALSSSKDLSVRISAERCEKTDSGFGIQYKRMQVPGWGEASEDTCGVSYKIPTGPAFEDEVEFERELACNQQDVDEASDADFDSDFDDIQVESKRDDYHEVARQSPKNVQQKTDQDIINEMKAQIAFAAPEDEERGDNEQNRKTEDMNRRGGMAAIASFLHQETTQESLGGGVMETIYAPKQSSETEKKSPAPTKVLAAPDIQKSLEIGAPLETVDEVENETDDEEDDCERQQETRQETQLDQGVQEEQQREQQRAQEKEEEEDFFLRSEQQDAILQVHHDKVLISFSTAETIFKQRLDSNAVPLEIAGPSTKKGMFGFLKGWSKRKHKVVDQEFLKRIAKTNLDWQDTFHQQLLCSLYQKLTNSSNVQPGPGSHWEEIGFQGSDPSTDLRACGCFGLLQALWFVENYEKDARQAFQLSRISQHEFPFMAVSLNLSLFALRSVRETTFANSFCYAGLPKRQDVSALQAANILYAASWHALVQKWRSGTCTVEQFGPFLSWLKVSSPKNLIRHFLFDKNF